MIKKLFLWLLLILLAVVGLFLTTAYLSFNTEAFKEQIVTAVNNTTGRTFSVNGPYLLTWDPMPTMTLENVSLSNIEQSKNKELFSAEKIKIEIEWASLFKTPIQIKKISVTRPKILIERINYAVTNFSFPRLFAPKESIVTENILGQQKQEARIESMSVQQGSVQYINHLRKTDIQFTDLTGEIKISSFSGPFGFSGTGAYRDLPLNIEASVSENKISSPIDYMLDIKTNVGQSHTLIRGQILPQNTKSYFTSKIFLESEKPNELLSKLSLPNLPASENKRFTINGNTEFSQTETKISEIAFKIEDENEVKSLSGQMDWTKATSGQSAAFSATLDTINLDVWTPFFESLVQQTNLNQSTAITFDISIPSAVWKTKKLTDIALSGTTQNNQIALNQESGFKMEENTSIQMSGLFDVSNLSDIKTQAQIDLKTTSLPAVLPLIPLSDTPLKQALQKVGQAELSLAVQWDKSNKTVAIPEFKMGELSGAFQMEQAPDTPTNISMELNNLNVNTYFPQWAKISEKTPSQALNEIFQKMATTKMPAKALNIQTTFTSLQWNTLNFEELALNAETTKENLQAESALKTTTNDTLFFQTNIENIGTPNWKIAHHAWEASGKNLPQILKDIGITATHKLVQNAQTFETTGELSGSQALWDINGSYQIQNQGQETTLHLQGQLAENKPQNLLVGLAHSSLPHLLTDLEKTNPFPALTGGVTIEALVNQTENTFLLSELFLTLDNQELQGEAAYNTNTKTLNLGLFAETLDVSKIIPDTSFFYASGTGFTGKTFDLSLLQPLQGNFVFQTQNLIYHNKQFQNAALAASVINKILTVENFSATAQNDSTFQLNGILNWENTPTLTFNLKTDEIALKNPIAYAGGIGLGTGTLSANISANTSGETPLQMARTLAGEGAFQITNSYWNGINFPQIENLLQQIQQTQGEIANYEMPLNNALKGGRTTVDNIQGSFTVSDGLFTSDDVTVSVSGASAENAHIDWDMPTDTIRANGDFVFETLANVPALAVTFNKDANGVKYTPQTEPVLNAITEQQQALKEQKMLEKQMAEEKRLQDEFNQLRLNTHNRYNQFIADFNQLEQSLTEIPNATAKKKLMFLGITVPNITKLISNPENSKQEYENISSQLAKLEAEIKTIQELVFKDKIDKLKTGAKALLNPANDAINKMIQMYQKRPTVSLIGDLLKNAQAQQQIITRALEQFQKPLSLSQVEKVSMIIQDAYDKIAKAYDYTEEIYSGRTTAPTQNAITKAN